MKNFLQYLTEVQKTYEFRIKIANIDPAEKMDVLEAALDAYGLESISKAKRLPIKSNDIDFPSIENCQIYLMDAVLKYPVNDAQLRAIVSERAGIPQSNIVVVSPNHPEEQRRWNLEGNDVREFKQGESVLDKDYSLDESEKVSDASKQYAESGSLLKELNSVKIDIAGTEKANGKTLNDVATSDVSPVGSKQNKIPPAVKGK
jgi:hypothetical protein